MRFALITAGQNCAILYNGIAHSHLHDSFAHNNLFLCDDLIYGLLAQALPLDYSLAGGTVELLLLRKLSVATGGAAVQMASRRK
jgi:hypothetical protein